MPVAKQIKEKYNTEAQDNKKIGNTLDAHNLEAFDAAVVLRQRLKSAYFAVEHFQAN